MLANSNLHEFQSRIEQARATSDESDSPSGHAIPWSNKNWRAAAKLLAVVCVVTLLAAVMSWSSAKATEHAASKMAIRLSPAAKKIPTAQTPKPKKGPGAIMGGQKTPMKEAAQAGVGSDVNCIHSRQWDATSRYATDVNVGDHVGISWFKGGYLKDDGDNTLSLQVYWNTESQVWVVEAGTATDSFKFKNYATGKYLRLRTVTFWGSTIYIFETGTDTGSSASWKRENQYLIGGQQFNYRRVYSFVENVAHSNKCWEANNSADDTILVSACTTTDHAFALEVLTNSGNQVC